jgi:pilus assembly protein FimV
LPKHQSTDRASLEQQSQRGDAALSRLPGSELESEPVSPAMSAQPAVGEPESSVAIEPSSADAAAQSSGGLMQSLTRMIQAIPFWAIASGVGVVVLGGLGLLVYRRRRQLAETEPKGTDDIEPNAPEPDMAVAAEMASSPPRAEAQAEELTEEDSLSIDLDMLSDSFTESTRETDLEPASEPAAEPAPEPASDKTKRAEPPRRPVRDTAPDVDLKTGLPMNVASNMTQGGLPDTQEVEILAEADIYILYGRYREAESILLEALAHSPARADLRFKLAESFIGSGNRDALAQLVEQMKAAGEDQLDAAAWSSIEQGLAAMAPVSEAGAGESPPPERSRPVTPAADASESAGVTLDLGAAGKDELASDDFRDSEEDSGLGFSVRELSPTSAERLTAQMEDLELDLKDLDDLGTIGELGADSDSLPVDSASAPVAGPTLELPDEQPPKSESMTEAEISTGFEDDLDLDLDALDKLANLDETTDPPDLTEVAVTDPAVPDVEDDKLSDPLPDPTLDSDGRADGG